MYKDCMLLLANTKDTDRISIFQLLMTVFYSCIILVSDFHHDYDSLCHLGCKTFTGFQLCDDRIGLALSTR